MLPINLPTLEQRQSAAENRTSLKTVPILELETSQIPDVIWWWFKMALVTCQKPCSPKSCELTFVRHSTGVVWGLSSTPVANVGGKWWEEEWNGSLKDSCKVFSGLESFKDVFSTASLPRSSVVLLVLSVLINVMNWKNFSSKSF